MALPKTTVGLQMRTNVLRKVKNVICSTCAVVYLVTFMFVLPILCHDMKYSLFYVRPELEIAQEKESNLNADRVKNAQAFLSSLNASVLNNTSQTNVDIAVTIITQSRKTNSKDDHSSGARYLTQTVAHFLKLLQEINQSNSSFSYTAKLKMCNIDAKGPAFTEAIDLQRYVPMITRFPEGNKKGFNVKLLEKEKQDYVFCLNQSLVEDKPRYVLLVEDDTLPNPNFLDVLKHTLDTHLEKFYQRGTIVKSTREDIAYVKFYHPDRLLHYLSFEPERLTELFGLAALCGLVSVLNSLCCKHMTSYVTCFVYFVLVFLVVGRSHINSFRDLFSPYLHTFSPAPSCCTPGVLFPRPGGKAVVNFLNGTQCKPGYGKDSALDTFIKTTSFKAYIVQPNTFTHIGMYSSLRKNVLHPSIL